MNWLRSAVFWGVVFILAGVLFLLQNLGYLTLGSLFWALVFGAAGGALMALLYRDRQQWWLLLPGGALLCVALVFLLDWLLPLLSAAVGEAVILAAGGLAFLLLYLVNRRHWWALVPFGTLLTLAGIGAFAADYPALRPSGLLLGGLALTFVLVAILPTPAGSMRWAWSVAGLLALAAALFLAGFGVVVWYLAPLALILIGGWLVWRAYKPG